ncbi:MAG: (2Fe-2S)-binding protein, partial [Myxococcaceae bacterium]
PAPIMRLLLVGPGDFFHNDWVTRFDPVRSIYTIHWKSADGAPRPFITQAHIFFVPETARTTRLHVFSFLRTSMPLLKPLLPLAAKAALGLTWWEVRDDARFIPTVADTPYSHKGMRLDRYDKPLVHQRKLMERIYYAREPEAVPRVIHEATGT